MRALVTGDAGFLGRHFSARLKTLGYTVCGADIVNGKNAHDVFLGRLYDGVQWDLVVHCAAVAPHRQAIDSMPAHFTLNTLLDAHFFEWLRLARPHKAVYVSSSAAYPMALQIGRLGEIDLRHRLREEDATLGPARAAGLAERSLRGYALVEPDGGYGRLKLNGERMAAEANASGNTVSVVRPFSGYGSDQGVDWPFGAFVDRAQRRCDPFEIWGDGTQVRDWTHVTDVVKAALAISDAGHTEPVNICTGVGTSMAELADMVCAEADYTPEVKLLTEKPAGVQYRVGDPAELHKFYTPQVTLTQGIRWSFA